MNKVVIFADSTCDLSEELINKYSRHKFNQIDEYHEWLSDGEPCLLNIILPEDTLLLPKMNWNEREMKPVLSQDITDKARDTLRQ